MGFSLSTMTGSRMDRWGGSQDFGLENPCASQGLKKKIRATGVSLSKDVSD